MSFPDHFSGVAEGYRAFRPTYPDVLFDRVAGACARRDVAWECGAGSGQATDGLVRRFHRVVATDASVAQLRGLGVRGASAVACLAEAPPLRAHGVDLVAVAQALHWFRLDAFYAEVRRVARAGSVVAAWTYGLPTVGPEVDEVLRRFAFETLGPFWPEERRHVDDGYRTLPFPFADVEREVFEIVLPRTAFDVVGWVGTWSAVQRAGRALRRDPLDGLRASLRRAWSPPERARAVCWPITLLLGRV